MGPEKDTSDASSPGKPCIGEPSEGGGGGGEAQGASRNSGSSLSTLAVPARGSSSRLAAKALAAAKLAGLSSGGSAQAISFELKARRRHAGRRTGEPLAKENNNNNLAKDLLPWPPERRTRVTQCHSKPFFDCTGVPQQDCIARSALGYAPVHICCQERIVQASSVKHSQWRLQRLVLERAASGCAPIGTARFRLACRCTRIRRKFVSDSPPPLPH